MTFTPEQQRRRTASLVSQSVEPAVELVLDVLDAMGVSAHANVYPGTGTVQMTIKGEPGDVSRALMSWMDGLALMLDWEDE